VLGVSEPGKPGRVVIWDTADITVGRSPENDLMVDDSDASRKHALFRRSSAGYQVEDLGTSNGTLVNDERIIEPHTLSNKDVIKICEMDVRFIETHKDPASLGLEVAYASQLKGFQGGLAPTADPSATTLGLGDVVSGPFNIGAVSDYTPQPPKDLDLEIGDFASATPDTTPPTQNAGALSIHLEVEGLGSDLRRTLEALFGKVIELPSMRVRIKSDDGL
jgi:predicted component of type VI protein secretion system